MTTKVNYKINGQRLSVEIPKGKANTPSFFVFGAHKSGSTLLNRVVGELCKNSEFPIIDFPSAYFRAGIPIDKAENAALVSSHLHEHGYAYLGARTFWCRDLGFNFSRVKKIILVRDPRDAIISWYFSDKKSHSIPQGHRSFQQLRKRLEGSTNPNEDLSYLKSRAGSLADLGRQYASIIYDDNTIVYRYEDVIFRKRLWLTDINAFLGMSVPKQKIYHIADRHDSIPGSEDPSSFIRQVYPGNHMKHFSGSTIDMLNAILDDYIKLFRYDRIERFVP